MLFVRDRRQSRETNASRIYFRIVLRKCETFKLLNDFLNDGLDKIIFSTVFDRAFYAKDRERERDECESIKE